MRYFSLFAVAVFFLLQSCDHRSREEALQKREARLNEKEQELLLKERSLQLKEIEIAKKQQSLDSLVVTDTLAKYNPALVGNWNVTMTCSETTCAGSAVGDTKTEAWEILYQNKNVIAKARVNDELVRVYSGIYTGNTLELAEMLTDSLPATTKIIARLQLVDDTRLQGQREIERKAENCRIVYRMEMNKK